jgi:hypothetical protein
MHIYYFLSDFFKPSLFLLGMYLYNVNKQSEICWHESKSIWTTTGQHSKHITNSYKLSLTHKQPSDWSKQSEHHREITRPDQSEAVPESSFTAAHVHPSSCDISINYSTEHQVERLSGGGATLKGRGPASYTPAN